VSTYASHTAAVWLTWRLATRPPCG